MPLNKTLKSPNSDFKKLKLPNPKWVFEKSAFDPVKFPKEKSIIFSDSKIESVAVKSIKSTFSFSEILFKDR